MSAILSVNRRQPDTLPGDQKKRSIDVVVLFTNVHGTLQALRYAAKLAGGLHARIRLLAPQVVPYPLPLEQPPARPSFLVGRFRMIAEHAGIDTTVDLRLCRDCWDGVKNALDPCSVVIAGGCHRRWCPPVTSGRPNG